MVMQSRTRELAFDAFDDFSDFVKSISCETSKTYQVRGSHRCRDPCGTVKWPRQKRQLAAIELALTEPNRGSNILSESSL